MRGVEALIFDCDGVIVDSESIAIATERNLLSSWGLNYEFEIYVSRFVGLHNRDFHAAVASDAELNGNPLPHDFVDQMQKEIWRRFEAELRAIKGVEEVVAAFPGRRAVASSSETKKLVRKLELTGLHTVFAPHIYSADLVAHGKPAPDLFLYVAKALGTPPETCLVVEDSVNGVKAARSAGMMVWGFTGGGHVDPGLAERLVKAGADMVFSSHDDIARTLKQA